MKSARTWSYVLRHRWWILGLVFALVATVLILSLGVIQPPDGFSTRSLLTLGLPIFVGIFIAMFGVKGIRDHLLGGEPD
ncbi:MAG TPA: hypothetical protein VKO87_00780, partial [Gemmatimonadaceae bacterium]|nr:hypothetical protein [Gemmatimonadaceae bacterium]